MFPTVPSDRALRRLCVKFSVLFCDVRPIHWFDRLIQPSTSTSCTARRNSHFGGSGSAADVSCRISQAPLLFFFRDVIFVLQRRSVRPLRILEREDANRTRLRRAGRASASKSSSVSPGKPTMMSVVIAMSRRRVLHPLDAPHVFVARIQPLHAAEHARRARLHRQMDVIAERIGFASIASMMSLTKSRGCEVVNRTRRIPGTSPTRPSS